MSQIEIGGMLREARFIQDMTQQEVADAIGVSLWTYNRLENGRRHFDQRWVERLPNGLRQPIVKHLQDLCHERLEFLHRLAARDSVRAASRPRFVRGDAPIAQIVRPRFVRGDERQAA